MSYPLSTSAYVLGQNMVHDLAEQDDDSFRLTAQITVSANHKRYGPCDNEYRPYPIT